MRTTARPGSIAASAVLATALGFACGRAATNASAPPPARAGDDASGLLARLSRNAGSYMSYGGSPYGAMLDATEPAPERDVRATMYGNFEFDEEPGRGGWSRPTQPYRTGYRVDDGPARGVIEGVVRWSAAPTRHARGCSGEAVIGARGEVAEAIVYLEDIDAGRQTLEGRTAGASHWRRLQIGGTLIARDCGAVPRVQQIAPLGSILRVSRQGPGPNAVIATPVDGSGSAPVFRLPLASGAERSVELSLPGIFAVRAAPTAPVLGWIAVQGHPYYAITGPDGAFRLDQVPPGTYRLQVWMPPLDPTSSTPALARPRIGTRSVVVRDGAVSRLVIGL